jgi:alcohol dehydrogenase class IV
MSLTSFSFPTQTLYGAGALRALPEHLERLGIGRPLVVTDPGVAHTDAFQSLRRVLGESNQDKSWFVFAGTHPNPIEANLRDAASAYQERACDGVIGFGGGSALDVGKAIRLLIKRPGFDLTRFYTETDWSGLAPYVAIPTTAGTGSEVGRSSVITLEATRRKGVLFHPALLAALAVLDPELTIGLPSHLTAATGADALTHCIESFTCPVFHPMCDGIALEGIRMIVDALPRAYGKGTDLDARGQMLVAAAMGAVAFQKDLGVVHSMAHPLSTLCGMHHGLANALCLVAAMNFNARRKPGLYRRVGVACGLEVLSCSDGEADCKTVGFMIRLLADLGLNTRLGEHGVRREQLDALVAQAWEDPCHKTNAVPVTPDDLRHLYLEVL